MPSLIDLRSDTVTRPSEGMRQAMASAEVGDDVFGEDPTVSELEERVAALLGKESALLCPSGTMANLIGITSSTSPGDEVLVDSESHILHYELAGSALIGGVQLRNFAGASAGCPTPDQLDSLQRLADPDHEPRTALLCLEQSHNRRGGTVTPLSELRPTSQTAHRMGLLVHLDGARLANAATRLRVPMVEISACADSLTLALSKGLGCPAGTLWVGSAETRRRAHTWRKRLGGGMRQVGILAAAGLYALDHNLDRLEDDHCAARRLAEILQPCAGVRVDPALVETNIVLLDTDLRADAFVDAARRLGVLTVPFGPHTVRCVTHLDVSGADIETAGARLRTVLAG
ncbi:MAG TPA: GntG family PLP-dependent aldolase [Candidatus Dormibacteraeota bacterium]|nr:GntG family PLP-dependent aldolase [Candidatus Dormibacteraeota bacterium]